METIHLVIYLAFIARIVNGFHQGKRCHVNLMRRMSGINGISTKMTTVVDRYDWSFLDGVYLITTTAKENKRLEKTQEELESVNLWNQVNVKTFDPDDSDRVRGCYTSHIKVLQEIQKKYSSKSQYKVLVVEDNIEKTLQIKSRRKWQGISLYHFKYNIFALLKKLQGIPLFHSFI